MTQPQSAEYGYRHVTTRVLMDDMAFGEQAPRLGHRLASFDLPLAQGGRVRSDDLTAARPLLLVSGSLSPAP